MRCKNCGWKNPDNALVCEKCHSKLTNNNPKRPSNSRPGDDRSMGKTPTVCGNVDESLKFAADLNEDLATNLNTPGVNIPGLCPACSYPVSEHSSTCPNCGAAIPPTFKSAMPEQPGSTGEKTEYTSASESEQKSEFKSTVIRSNPAAGATGSDFLLIPQAGYPDLNPGEAPEGVNISLINDEWTIEADPSTPVYIRVNGAQFKLLPDDEIIINGVAYKFSQL